MSRPCSDHIAGYRIIQLRSEEDQWEYLDALTKSQRLARSGYAVAVPYRDDGSMRTFGLTTDEYHGLYDILRGGPGAAPLPAGAVLVGYDDSGELRVLERSELPGQPDPGYTPVSPDALLGQLRRDHLISDAMVAAAVAGYRSVTDDARAQYQAFCATDEPLPDSSWDAVARQVVLDRLMEPCPALGHLNLVETQLDELRIGLAEGEWEAMTGVRDDAIELHVAVAHGIPLERVESVCTTVASLPYAGAELDPGELESRPDQSLDEPTVHLLMSPGWYEYNDWSNDEYAPCTITGLVADREAREAIEADARIVAGLVQRAHSVRAALPNRSYHGYSSEYNPGELDTIPLSLVDAAGRELDGPVTLDHGCVYVLVTMRPEQRWKVSDVSLRPASWDAAFTSLADAQAFLDTRVVDGLRLDDTQLPSVAELAGLPTPTAPGRAAPEGWEWVRRLPGRMLGRAAWDNKSSDDPDAPGDQSVIVAFPIEDRRLTT